MAFYVRYKDSDTKVLRGVALLLGSIICCYFARALTMTRRSFMLQRILPRVGRYSTFSRAIDEAIAASCRYLRVNGE